LFLPRYGQPDADALHNLSTAIIVDQQPFGGNPRSTLGTATDVYTMLRVLFAAGNVVVRHVQEVKLHSRQARAHPSRFGQIWALPGFRPSVGKKTSVLKMERRVRGAVFKPPSTPDLARRSEGSADFVTWTHMCAG
jgi:hypothetical protein